MVVFKNKLLKQERRPRLFDVGVFRFETKLRPGNLLREPGTLGGGSVDPALAHKDFDQSSAVLVEVTIASITQP